jgi:hypothetical protein
MSKHDWNDIDEPIRDIMDRLTELGYTTVESCCGFSYPTNQTKYHTTPFIGFDGGVEKIVDLIRAVGHTWGAYFIGAVDRWNIGVTLTSNHMSPEYCWDVFRKGLDKLEEP